ncbi:MAG: hypothetical protein JWO53_224 [Chlamydiia bacterium]|nr:hypothetical protein [Chlamydiia bacterium]
MAHEKHPLTLYTDRLKSGGDIEEIDETIDPSCLGVQASDDVTITAPITIYGQAYVVDEYLVLDLNITTEIKIPCAFCNDEFVLPIKLKHAVHEESLDEIKHGAFDAAAVVREMIYLEVPLYPQCGGSSCLRRSEVEKYLKKEEVSEGYQPFIDI